MNFYAVSALINFATSIVSGIFVIGKERKSKNISFFIFCFFVALWSISYFFWQVSETSKDALLWCRVLMAFAVFIPVTYLQLVYSLVDILHQKKRFLVLSYILFFLFFFTDGSSYFVSRVEPIFNFQFWPVGGPLFSLFLIIWVLYIIYSTYLLYDKYQKSAGFVRMQMVYVLLGMAVGFAGGVTNYFLWYQIPVPPIANALISVNIVAIAYTLLRYRLLDIRLIVAELATFALWADLFAKLFFLNNVLDLIANSFIFLIAVIFGIFLIRSVLFELRLRQKTEEINQALDKAYKAEKRVKEDLERVDKFKDQFLQQTQHDLRTPLTSIVGYTDMLIKGMYGKQNQKSLEVLGKVRGLSDAVVKKANNFLDLAQFQLGKSVLQLEPGVSLNKILEEVKNELDFKTSSKGLKLILELPLHDITITADREKLKAALFNIVDNAVKYTQEGSVTVRLRPGANRALVEVQDTGIGIEPEKIPGIFDTMFSRSEEAKKTAAGAGVGLYLSAQIIKEHHGYISVESPGIGKGTTFKIELPLSTAPAAAGAVAQPPAFKPRKGSILQSPMGVIPQKTNQ